MTISDAILQELHTLADPEKAKFLQKFFKTGKGEYAENDVFLGIKVPDVRKVVKRHQTSATDDIQTLLDSEYHEARLAGLLALCACFEAAETEEKRKDIVNFYLANTAKINNWDLVDISCRTIIGGYLWDKKDRSLLYRLADSGNLWEERIAVVSTWMLIKHGKYEDTLRLAEKFFTHKHDLIHKAVGWMLREAGKKDKTTLTNFLDAHAAQLPRTALRYAIEIFPETERKQYLNIKPVQRTRK
ncbi:MAG: DNA alkylation repair protein [Bacteroidales bacterium]|jgi:3-methyladenine DNA glycosylase AlkD|nr:DNA alkylation repair protein [Bacteroidales bacterium]